MKKSVAMKMFLIMLVSVICISMTSFVFATDIEDLDNVENLDLTSNVANNTSTNNTSTNNTSRNNTSLSTNLISSSTNNTSANNVANTSLPKTGISDAIPTALLVVIFGISAVYAYKKIKDYRNI